MNIFHFEITEHEPLLQTEDANVEYSSDQLDTDTATKAANAEVVTIFVNSRVDRAVLDAMPNLKLLVTRSTGFDHIDTAYAKTKDITVCNVPAYGSRTVAEFTFALILSLSRKVPQAVEQIREKNGWDISAFQGFNLQGKTLGIVGTGKIGINVAQIAHGFDLKIIAHDAFPNEGKAKEFGFTYVDTLEKLLVESDIVTLHVPAMKETHHLINEDNIVKMKKGALLINTSRGDVVDPKAILVGLQKDILGGVGLDVLEGEHELQEEAELMGGNKLNQEQLMTLLENHVLMNQPNVIITPHIAFDTIEAKAEIISTSVDNIQSYLAGQPKNVVNA